MTRYIDGIARLWTLCETRSARRSREQPRQLGHPEPAAQLDGRELDLRLLVDHRERLIRQRVALNNTLQWHLHNLWPELVLPGSSLFYGRWAPRVARRLARAEQTMRVRIARDELRRVGELPGPSKHSSERSPGWWPRSRRSCSPSPASDL
jgi:hypothetical protein